MSIRTPTADGLTVAPNAAADANNPAASAQELAVHRFWGRWDEADDLPNAAANAATSPAYDQMRPGDVAFVSTDQALYQLLDRGTDGGSDAVWMLVGGGGSSSALDVLWEWNRTDLTQLDTGALLDFANTLGNGPSANSIIASYVADVFQGNPGIRLTVDTLVGGFVLPVLASELVLPERYIMEARIAAIDQSLVGCICPWGNQDANTNNGTGWRGAVFRRDGATTVNQHRLTTFGAAQTEQVLRNAGITDSQPLADTWNTTLEQRAGATWQFECFRQASADPNDWAWRTVYDDPSNYQSGALARQQVTGFADTSPDWDGENMTRFGIGILDDVGGNSGSVDFLDLRVFAHPFDR